MSKRFHGVLVCLAVVLISTLGLGSRPASAQATISIVKADAPDPVLAGASLTYTITATASGLDLEDATVTDPLPAGTTFVSLSAPAGWSCSTPAVGTAGTVSCTEAPMPAGSAVFTLVVQVSASLANGTVLTNQVGFVATSGGRPSATSATATTQVTRPADAVAVPALDAPGLLMLALLLAAAGTVGLRRRGLLSSPPAAGAAAPPRRAGGTSRPGPRV